MLLTAVRWWIISETFIIMKVSLTAPLFLVSLTDPVLTLWVPKIWVLACAGVRHRENPFVIYDVEIANRDYSACTVS